MKTDLGHGQNQELHAQLRRQLVPKNVRQHYFEFPSRVNSCKGAFEQADVLITKVVVLGSGSTTNVK